jgi:hypothetical protein
MPMKVQATEMGFMFGTRMRPGMVFDLPDGSAVPGWCQLVEEGKEPPPLPKKRNADTVVRTLSELTKKNHPTS